MQARDSSGGPEDGLGRRVATGLRLEGCESGDCFDRDEDGVSKIHGLLPPRTVGLRVLL